MRKLELFFLNKKENIEYYFDTTVKIFTASDSLFSILSKINEKIRTNFFK